LSVYEVDLDDHDSPIYNMMVCTFKFAGVVRLPSETEAAVRPKLAERDAILFNGKCKDGVSLVLRKPVCRIPKT
jgi:hypothetical protein